MCCVTSPPAVRTPTALSGASARRPGPPEGELRDQVEVGPTAPGTGWRRDRPGHDHEAVPSSQQTGTIPPEDFARLRQELPFHSVEWENLYPPLRARTEGMNGMLKDGAHEALDVARRRRVHGVAAQSFFTALMCMSVNLRVAAGVRRKLNIARQNAGPAPGFAADLVMAPDPLLGRRAEGPGAPRRSRLTVDRPSLTPPWGRARGARHKACEEGVRPIGEPARACSTNADQAVDLPRPPTDAIRRAHAPLTASSVYGVAPNSSLPLGRSVGRCRMSVGCRQNPLHQPRRSSICGHFPRYRLRFPTLLLPQSKAGPGISPSSLHTRDGPAAACVPTRASVCGYGPAARSIRARRSGLRGGGTRAVVCPEEPNWAKTRWSLIHGGGRRSSARRSARLRLRSSGSSFRWLSHVPGSAANSARTRSMSWASPDRALHTSPPFQVVGTQAVFEALG